MADWFRPVFARTKSSLGISHSPTAVSASNAHKSDAKTSRKTHSSSRIPSFIGIHSNTPSFPAPESFSHVRPARPVRPVRKGYPRLDIESKVESLKATMMTHDTMMPISRGVYPLIMHVLEGYEDLQELLVRKQLRIVKLKLARIDYIKELRMLKRQWRRAEKNYTLEIKRLEVLLSNTSDMEAVAMARSNSTVHGKQKFFDNTKSVKTTVDMGENINALQHEEVKQRKKGKGKQASEKATSKAFNRYRSRFENTAKDNVTLGRTSCSGIHIVGISENVPSPLPSHGTATKDQGPSTLPALPLKQEQDHRQAPTMIETLQSTSEKCTQAFEYRTRNQRVYDEGIDGQILHQPVTGRDHSGDDIQNFTLAEADDNKDSHSTSQARKRFSFQPGDDNNLLSSASIDNHEQLVRKGGQDVNLHNDHQSESPRKQPNPRKNVSPSSKSHTKIPQPSQRGVDNGVTVSRGDSMNSVVTAYRHNSSRSSLGSQNPSIRVPQKSSADKRVRNESIEAVAAAAKAYNWKPPNL